MDEADKQLPWYAGVTRYEWLVLAIASAGWIFDVFEGQLFNITRGQMLSDLLGTSTPAADEVKRWGDLFLAVFLVGGTLGGVLFGSLADRIGRKPTMVITILCYSVFSGLTFFATELWHVAALRFLVALGVGGEWAVAASLVAEVFPARARANASGIFHATSVLGTWLATVAGMVVNTEWRYAYLIGILPALLVLWVRSSVEEPQSWRQAQSEKQRLGSFRELLGVRRWAQPALLGMLLAAVGLGTFWGVTVAGQDLTQDFLSRHDVPAAEAAQKARFAFGFVQTAGGGLGLLCFGPLAQRLGRRPAFALMQLAALVVVPATCFLPRTYNEMLMILPVFGFFTLGIHAGFAIYFPELFPNNLRATGTGFCFNGGRLLAAPILWFSGELKSWPGVSLQWAITLLSLLFVLGIALLWFLPETKGRPLPE
ncbi:MAG: MFS transporter [Planctomycetota bacterium]|nr:MAG: MFS transporter [Planctomycetota bacterium]